MIKKQFTLYLENKPGRLAKLTRSLAKDNVNIEGISVSESTDVGLVQIVPSNAVKMRAALKRARIPYTVQDVALLPLKHKPGSLSKVITGLAREGVNINYVYATGCAGGNTCDCHAIISAPNLKAVENAWHNTG
jgi:hypothetical protein